MNSEVDNIEALSLAPQKLEDQKKDPLTRLKKGNLAGNELEKVTFIVEGLEKEFESALISFLKECQDVFAWSYEDMPELRTKLITHRLAIDLTYKPVKQVGKEFQQHHTTSYQEEY